MTETAPKFECWAIVEVMGHLKLAGYVTEQSIAGTAMLRVDVPCASQEGGSYTRYFGGASIYSISPCTEEVARSVASRSTSRPVSSYDISGDLRAKYEQPALPGPPRGQFEDYEDSDESIDGSGDDIPY